MDYTVIWSNQALEDIEGIAAYISDDSVYHAERVVEAFLAAGNSLTQNAQRGPKIPELNIETLRELFVYSYRLIYELDTTAREVQILAALHGRRLLTSHPEFIQE